MLNSYTFNALNITAELMFFGSDEEIEAAEKKEAERKQFLKDIILSENFLALEILPRYEKDLTRYLHHSTRPGYLFQLSNSDSKGPLSHSNYTENDIDKLLEEVARLSFLTHDMTIRVLTK